MRHVLAIVALTLLPAAAEAGIITVKNCSPFSVDVRIYRPDATVKEEEDRAVSGGIASLYCPGAACRLEVSYYMPVAALGQYPGLYSDNRCTRGAQDIGGDLPAAGTCGC